MKSGQLVEFLGSWRGNGKMLVEQMKNCGLYFMKITTLNSKMWSLCSYGCNVSLNAYKFPELNFKTAISSPKYHQSNATRGLLQPHSQAHRGRRLSLLLLSPPRSQLEKMMMGLLDTRSFWTSDMHDATITDMPSVLAKIVQSYHCSIIKCLQQGAYIFQLSFCV